jgi:nucleolar protein 9
METVKKTRRGKRSGKSTKKEEEIKVETKHEVNEVGAVEKKKRLRGARPSQKKQAHDVVTQEINLGAVNEVEQKPQQLMHPFPMLPNDLRMYLETIQAKINDNEFEDDEEKDVFLANIYKEMDGHELSLATDPDGSKIFEQLLSISSDFYIRAILSRVSGHLNILVIHPFASHVVQTLLVLAADVVHREQLNRSLVELKEGSELKTASDLIVDFCQELNQNWTTYLKQAYASHIFRTILCLLSGTAMIDKSNKSSVVDLKKPVRRVPPAFKNILDTTVSHILNADNRNWMRSLIVNTVSSPALQHLIALDTENRIINAILYEDENGAIASTFIKILIHDKVGSHFMQELLKGISKSEIEKLYDEVLKGNLMSFSLGTPSNFIVQTFLEVLPESKIVPDVLEELIPNIPRLLDQRKSGVVSKLAYVCMVHRSNQMGFFKVFFKFMSNTCRSLKSIFHLRRTLCFLLF